MSQTTAGMRMSLPANESGTADGQFEDADDVCDLQLPRASRPRNHDIRQQHPYV